MPLSRALRRALPVSAVALLLASATSSAFQPTVPLQNGNPNEQLAVTDVASRGSAVVVTVGIEPQMGISLLVSTDHGVSFDETGGYGLDDIGRRDAQATICAGDAVEIYRAAASGSPTVWSIESYAQPLDGGAGEFKRWPDTAGAKAPDVACVANDELVTAWFEKRGSSYHVRVRTRRPRLDTTSPQSFDLGVGSVSRGLSVATTADRVYVTWFQGTSFKIRRFSIGNSASHTLTSLGTSTIANLQYGYYPQIGAHGDRVILTYMDKASLKVRRSTNKGSSFGAAKTIRSEAFPGEIGAYPTTVAVVGSKVAIGAVEVQEGGGKGLGYLSTNGGASYTKVSSHTGGAIGATLVKVGSSYKYAEAWDQSFSQPDPQHVFFRRQ